MQYCTVMMTSRMYKTFRHIFTLKNSSLHLYNFFVLRASKICFALCSQLARTPKRSSHQYSDINKKIVTRTIFLFTPEEIRLAALAIDVTPLAPYMSCGQPINKVQGSALGSLAPNSKAEFSSIFKHK